MIKHINHQNFLTTPFVAVKQWELFSIQNDDVVLIEPPDSSPEYPVALEYLDYNDGVPIINRSCNIALEQQEADVLNYQEGVTGSGIFYPDTEPKNSDGTYKRMVHTQTKLSFYNQYRNPTQIFGVEFIDFPLGKTNRELSDVFRLFSIPRHFFGDRLVEGSIRFYDTSLDDTVEITDDGYQNLLAGPNLFSKVQEVRGYNIPEAFENIIMDGTASCDCPKYGDVLPSASVHDSSSTSVGFESGSLAELAPYTDSSSLDLAFYTASLTDADALSGSAGVGVGYVYGSLNYTILEETVASVSPGFYTGSLFETIVSMDPVNDTGSVNILFYSGSIFDQIVSLDPVNDTGSVNILFYSGSIFDTIVSGSAGDTGSLDMGYYTGSLADVAVITPENNTYQTMSISFLNGTRSVVTGGTGYATSSNGTIVPQP